MTLPRWVLTLIAALLVTATAAAARAQSSTSGAIQGVVKDRASNEPLAGVTVVATSAALQGAQTVATDDNGYFKISSLPPGTYTITFYYAEITVRRDNVEVGVQKVTPVYQDIATEGAGQVIIVDGKAPAIDPTSTSQGITLDEEYLRNIPVPGRTFEDALGAAAGSQGDGTGVAFSGSTSLENQYYVDGLNTTGLRYGTVGNPVIVDFIEEIEVITGGYNAEYGRATGGIVNVVTKSGSNELEGSVFGYYSPGQLIASREPTPTQASFIDAEDNVAYGLDVGADLGGPIIRDRLWFYAGVQPSLQKVDVTRRIKRRTNCRAVLPDGSLTECDPRPEVDGGYADSRYDVDPETGFFITDTVEEKNIPQTARQLSFLGKLNFQVSPEHQGQASVVGLPFSSRTGGVFGLRDSTEVDTRGLTTDASLSWTSKLNDNKTELEAAVGWHRATVTRDAANDAYDALPFQLLRYGSLGDWAKFGGESARVVDMCTDDVASDPYRGIVNCPEEGGAGYAVGGPGSLIDDKEERWSARLSAIQRVDALGNHELKAGIDVESNRIVTSRRYSGGAFFINNVGLDQIQAFRWVQLDDSATPDPRFDQLCRDTAFGEEIPCDHLPGTAGYPGTEVTGNTLNWAVYLRDSWRIRPNLTINAGIRYEEQRLRYADELQNTVDPLTDQPRGDDAMVLTGMLAPRIGVLYDWTREGRSKIYGHWGRFYESIPLDINDRSFGGEVQYTQDFVPSACGPYDERIGGRDAAACGTMPNQTPDRERLFGSSGVLVAPGIQAQYLDELIVGVEAELFEDLKVGISYQNRWLGRVIEDVSTDGARTYIIANPGEWSQEEEDELEAEIARTTDPATRERLERELVLFRGIRLFDEPRRDYGALQVTLTRRFSRALYVQGSYTYSRTRGNFPGLVSYDNGQVDPNISSQYDLIELLANRDGGLPQDRPHYFKIDGYYQFDLRKQGQLIVGVRARALSGTPIDALGAHYRYGGDEAFLLPRGLLGRSSFEHGVDLRLAYQRELGGNRTLEAFVDLFNVYNNQGVAAVDETYASSLPDNNVNPIVGADYEDLIWAKGLDQNGAEPRVPQSALRNPNFGNPIARYAPFSARFGMRLTF
jgi:hypothetical protein